MTVDARCLIATDLGILKDGSGLSEDHAQETGLVTYRGTFIFDGVLTPPRGRVIQVAYARPQYGASGLLTRFYPRLHVISSSADPYENQTTVEVGCRLTLMRERSDAIIYSAIDHPPSWWSALTDDRKTVVAPTIQAQKVIEFCLNKLGIPLAAGSSTTPDVLVRDEIDLSGGYVSVIDDLLRSALLVGYINPAGELFVQPVNLLPAPGPVLTKDNLLTLRPINDRAGAEQVTVEFDAIEAPDNAETIRTKRVLNDSDTDRDADTQRRRSYELDRTISPPQRYEVVYTSPTENIQKIAAFECSPVSEAKTVYRTIAFTDADGKRRSQDVAVYKSTVTRSCAAEANPSYGTSVLSAGGFSFNGGATDITRQETSMSYTVSKNGPRLATESTSTFHTGVKFAGSLGIADYVVGGVLVELSTNEFLVAKEEVRSETDESAGITKRATTRWSAAGKKQSGSQGSAASGRQVATAAETAAIINAALPLVCEGTEVTVNIGRQFGVQQRPSQQNRQQAELLNEDVDDNRLDDSGIVARSFGRREPQTVTTTYAFGGADPDLWSTVTYRLPYSPDDSFIASNGAAIGIVDLTLLRGNARARALEYGRVQNTIAFGHANGVEVTTAAWELPSAPFAPVYIDVSGLSTAFRVHGRNWVVQNGALVVTADLMMVGAAGRFTDTPVAWMPLTSPAADLPVIGAPTGSGDILPANTITLPAGFDPAAPGSVWSSLPTNGVDTYGPRRTPGSINPPYVETVSILGVSRSAVVVTELLYSLAPTTDSVLAVSRSRAEVRELVLDMPPAVQFRLTPQAPFVYAPVPTTAAQFRLIPQSPEVTGSAYVEAPRPQFRLIPRAPIIEASGRANPPAVVLKFTPQVPTVTGDESSGPTYETILFLEMQGANGSTTFADSSSYNRQITALGNAQISNNELLLNPDPNAEFLDSLLTEQSETLILGTDYFRIEGEFSYEQRPPSSNFFFTLIDAPFFSGDLPQLSCSGNFVSETFGWVFTYGEIPGPEGGFSLTMNWEGQDAYVTPGIKVAFALIRDENGTSLELNGVRLQTDTEGEYYTESYYLPGEQYTIGAGMKGRMDNFKILTAPGTGGGGGEANCADAPVAVDGPNPFTTFAGGGNLGMPATDGCGDAHTIYNVTYFSYTAATSGVHTFSLCGGSDWDTRIAVLNTCDPGDGVLGCNDDFCGAQSQTTATLETGMTCKVVIGGFDPGSAGPGILTITAPSG